VVASVTVGLLVVVSLAFTATTLFPDLSRSALGAGLAGATAVGLLVAVYGLRREAAARTSVRVLGQIATGVDRASWRTPPLSELRPPHWSPARKLALLLLRGYVLVAALLVVIKVVQLAVAR
jgi:hypothetical protein